MLAFGIMLLQSCKKDDPTNAKKEEKQQVGHVLGYYIESTFMGTWQLKGSYIGEFDDVGSNGWTYHSLSYQDKYIDFQQNGLRVSYTLSPSGIKTNNDTLIYSNSAAAVSPQKLRYFNYQPVADSNGNTIYEFAYPLHEQIVTRNGNTAILELNNVDNSSQIDTLEFVVQ